eukprot:SAG31_NODE_11655_length_1010_cov_0.961581_1_plen_65_part_00
MGILQSLLADIKDPLTQFKDMLDEKTEPKDIKFQTITKEQIKEARKLYKLGKDLNKKYEESDNS